MSVAREDAAAPYITDFWPGNTNLAAVWSATLCCPSTANGSVHARHTRPELNGSANTFRCEAPRFYDCVPRSPEWALTCLHDGGDKSGELDGQLALEANARAYLNAIWATGAPRWCWRPVTTRPASTGVGGSNMLGGFHRWTSVLELDTSPRGKVLTRILIDVTAEAWGMVIECEDAADVGPITDAMIEWIDRLTS